MEGQSITSNKLRFVESRKKFQTDLRNQNGHKLIAAANNHGLIILCLANDTIGAVPTDQLLDFSHAKDKASTQTLNQFSFVTRLTFRPTLLSVARHGYSSVLLVAGLNPASNCPFIQAINLDSQQLIGQLELTHLKESEIVDYAWHPNFYESIVALCTSRGALLIVAINKIEKGLALVFSTDQHSALTCCWSPKGKNLAIGMTNGGVLRLEPIITPTSFELKEVDKSLLTLHNSKITSEHRLVRLRWLNKSFLLSVHARSDSPCGPDTVYSVITVKPGKPYYYWTNICFENQDSPAPHVVNLVNLSNSVICSSSASGEAGVIGVDGLKEAKSNDINDWKSIMIDEEGARIELPLDANNQETYPRGVTVAFVKSNDFHEVIDRPILIFYSSDSIICSYAAMHSDDILKLPEFQPAQDCPIAIPKISLESEFSLSLSSAPFQTLSFATPLVNKLADKPIQAPSTSLFKLNEPEPSKITIPVEVAQNKPVKGPARLASREMEEIGVKLSGIASTVKNLKEVIKSLSEINNLRSQIEDVQEIHTIHKEVFDAIKEDIDVLDVGMLENFYLVEYIRSRKVTRRKSLDPITLKKVESIKLKSKIIAEKLRDLHVHVDVAWENFVRRKTALESKDRRMNSLDIIYKTLANNQKIINALKRKASSQSMESPAVTKSPESYCDTVITKRELDPAKIRVFREFLSSRDAVPVRRPESVKQTLRKLQFEQIR